MKGLDRRRFLVTSTSVSVPFFTDLGFLTPLTQSVAAEATFEASAVAPNADLRQLVQLIRQTPRDKCVAVFIQHLRGGLSYQQFLSALFLACA